MTSFLNEDFTIYRNENNQFMGGGYSINSMLLNPNNMKLPIPEFQPNNNFKITDIFNNLAVPAGLCYTHQLNKSTISELDDNISHNVLSDDIYDKLFALINVNNVHTKIHTRKKKMSSANKKTKKQKNN